MMMTVMFASQNETKHRAAERREAKNSKERRFEPILGGAVQILTSGQPQGPDFGDVRSARIQILAAHDPGAPNC